MTAYTIPIIGGLVIGLAAVILLLLLGKMAGISGIIWDAISAEPDNLWRWTFLIGLIIAPVAYHFISHVPYPAISALSGWHAAAGGLLVGFGVKLGSGCTSGHGVCGIGRLSPRSLVATLIFLGTGIGTVYLIRHVLPGYLS
ncbi:MAG: YeeE/YedE family protein [Pseudomonadota bacterium]